MAKRKQVSIGAREDYYWQNLRESGMTTAQMRAQYAKMRSIVNKRYQRIKQALPKSQMAKKDYFQPLARGAKKADVMHELARVATAYYDQWGSLTAQRKQRAENIQTMHEHGYKFVTEENYDEFVDFMEEIRARKMMETFYSEEHGMDIFSTANKAGVDPQILLDDFDYFKKNYGDFERVMTSKGRKGGLSSEQIKELMRKKDPDENAGNSGN